MSDELFVTPLRDVLPRAVQIAQEAWEGELGDAAEEAYQAQMDRSLTQAGMTIEELDQLGAPRSWFGRMVDRAQDWWWDRKYAAEDAADGLEAAFAFPVPVLQTKPLQDTPFEYDEVDQMMEAAILQIRQVIDTGTKWTAVAFGPFIYDEESYDFDPKELMRGLWQHPDGSVLVLADGVEDDPKLMGHALGLLHLPAQAAAALLD